VGGDIFIDTIGEMSERFEMDVRAYVLMDNHYHLLVRTRQANLKKAINLILNSSVDL
jgi:REP element-mobilizing transposase RayT